MPADCGGFVSAVRAAIGGDDGPLRQWHRDARPRLERSLIRAGLDAALADDAAERLIEEAFVSVSTNRPPSNELAWAASVIRTARSRRIRERARWSPFEDRERASPDCDPASLADRAETIRRVRAAIADLPSPWRDALELHCLREWCVEDVAAHLHAWRGVGVERTRKILATGRQMLAARLSGQDPRRIWPRRFRKSAWTSTRAPRVAAHLEEARCDVERAAQAPDPGIDRNMLVTVAENVVMVASNGAPVVTSSDPIRLGGEDRASAHLVVESMWGTCGNVPRLTIRTYVSNDGVSFVEVLPGQVFDTTTVGLKADVRAVHGAFVRYVFTLDPAGTPTLGPAAASFDLHVLFDHS